MDIENWTIEKALEIGAEMELESYTLYTETAKNAKYPGAKKLLLEIAEDEKRHREYFLQGLEDPKNIKMRHANMAVMITIADNILGNVFIDSVFLIGSTYITYVPNEIKPNTIII